MADIFVSYSRQDKARAAQFVELLEGFGWDVFWDQETRAGTLWPKVLEDELGLARCLLVLWTANSVTSRWVRIEAYEALQGDKLLPVRLENVKPPMEFRQTQTFDLLNWTGQRDDPRLDHLIADLCALMKLEPRKGTIGPATLTAVRTLKPATLGVSAGRPTPPEAMAFADAGPVSSEPVMTEPAATDPVTTEPVTTDHRSPANSQTTSKPSDSTHFSRTWIAVGSGLAAVAGIWLASSAFRPSDDSATRSDKPKEITTVSEAGPPAAPSAAAASSAAATPTAAAAAPVAESKPARPAPRPAAVSVRCIEITERFQQTGQLSAEERKFLGSKECAQ